MEAEIVTENPLKLFSLFQPNAGASRPKGNNMDSTYQRAMNANVTPQIFSTMVSNAQKVAEAFAGSVFMPAHVIQHVIRYLSLNPIERA